MEGSQVRRRVLHCMRDYDRAVAFGIRKVRGAVGTHASREPQRLCQDERLRGSGVGRHHGLTGFLRSPDLRIADPEPLWSELGLIERSAALRVGPERHAVGAYAAGVAERLVVGRAAARRPAPGCRRAELCHVTAPRTATPRRQERKGRKGAGENGETKSATRHFESEAQLSKTDLTPAVGRLNGIRGTVVCAGIRE